MTLMTNINLLVPTHSTAPSATPQPSHTGGSFAQLLDKAGTVDKGERQGKSVSGAKSTSVQSRAAKPDNADEVRTTPKAEKTDKAGKAEKNARASAKEGVAQSRGKDEADDTTSDQIDDGDAGDTSGAEEDKAKQADTAGAAPVPLAIAMVAAPVAQPARVDVPADADARIDGSSPITGNPAAEMPAAAILPDTDAKKAEGNALSGSDAAALLQLVRDMKGKGDAGVKGAVNGHAHQDAATLGATAANAGSASDNQDTADGDAKGWAGATLALSTETDATPYAATLDAGASRIGVGDTSMVPDLSVSLGDQVVDMGVSGQWIDGLARNIASLSSNGAQGRFQIDTQQLGTVQVNIRQDGDGAAVNLTVASQMAEDALRQDSDRLKLDSALSAVRIHDVKVDRVAHVVETGRTESHNQQDTQQHGSAQTAWQGQGMGQSQSQAQSQARGQARDNIAPGAKAGGDSAVMGHEKSGDSAGTTARARYA